MKLKKAGALGLSCVIALGSMAGCGSSKEKEKTDGKEEISGEIRYAFWDTTQQPYFEKCIEKFNEQYPDVKVTLEPSSWDEYWTKLEEEALNIADYFTDKDSKLLITVGKKEKEIENKKSKTKQIYKCTSSSFNK